MGDNRPRNNFYFNASQSRALKIKVGWSVKHLKEFSEYLTLRCNVVDYSNKSILSGTQDSRGFVGSEC